MKLFRDRKIVLLAVILMLGMALASYVHAMELEHHSMDMSDCSTSVYCLACVNPLPSSIRFDHSLSPSLDAMPCFHMKKVIGPAVSHYHPPG